MSTFFIGAAGSAVVAIIYGVFIAQRETQIRNYLSIKRRGWARKIYVKAFVGAVKGHAAVTEIHLLVYLIIFALYGSYTFLVIASNKIGQHINSTDSRYQALKFQTGLTTKPEIQPTQEIQKIQEELLVQLEEWKNLKLYLSVVVTISHVVSILCLLMCCICFVFWYPFIIMRRLFAHEVERFMLRIQGLASNEDLVELTIAESQVANEATLRAFVEVIRRVAVRHNIPQLVKTFDLWRDSMVSNNTIVTPTPTL